MAVAGFSTFIRSMALRSSTWSHDGSGFSGASLARPEPSVLLVLDRHRLLEPP